MSLTFSAAIVVQRGNRNADAPAKLRSGESARAVVPEQHRDLRLVLLVLGFHPAMSTVARMELKMGWPDAYGLSTVCFK
jgi:hypothetical protein